MSSTTPPIASDVLVIGAGLAGLITATELLRAGRRVTLVDRDTPERLGGLARWAFGGMALVDTPLQRRMKVLDSPERALADWIRFGELGEGEYWPRQWAAQYVERSRPDVYDWLVGQGLRFMPAVNWVERGLYGEGNTRPRYHVLWGTALALTRRSIERLHEAAQAAGRGSGGGHLTLLHRHRITALEHSNGRVTGAVGVDEASGAERRFVAEAVVLATGGLNGSHAQVRANWPTDRPMPVAMLNGAHPFSDGALHRAAAGLGAQVTHAGEMWNYAAGMAHPQPQFPGHGLSLIPCKSALWLDASGRRLGPQPLVTGFDTHDLCQRVAALPRPWTWQLLNRRIAAKELAISGAEHNPRIRDRQMLAFLKETLLGNHRLVRQLAAESADFLVDHSLAGLAAKMNALTGGADVDPTELQRSADAFDANFALGDKLNNDDQLRRIRHARQWGPDRLRTCAPAPLQQRGAGPFIAIRLQLITRKSLGGLQTDLASRVLGVDPGQQGHQAQPLPGLWAVGEAAGFGGGGASGRRSLEGTFLPGCILTARAAAASFAAG